jgi:thiamine biosynthesis lipoprotein
MRSVLVRQQLRAMGTECVVAVTASRGDRAPALRALAAARTEIEACERVLTRFDARSDLSRMNARAGDWVEVDPRLAGALRAALQARRDTDGRFDPTILLALEAAGYDRTYEELEHRPPRAIAGWRAGAAVAVDEDGCRARVERGAAVDLGGIGKGYSAMRALEAMRLAWRNAPGGFVDLGGDLAFAGIPPGGGRWRVAVADPRHPGTTVATLLVERGGVATSGRDRRRFGPDRRLHHLIDPRTGLPAARGPLAVTVVAPDAALAEAYATALAIADPDDARTEVERHSELAALFIPEGAEPIVLGPLPLAPRLRVVLAA